MNATGRMLAHASLLLTPLLYPQGVYTRLKIGRQPEAGGAQSGRVEGGSHLVRVLLLGESTVAGVGVASHDEGLAGETATALNAYTGASVAWRVFGANGLTAAALRNRLEELPPETRADLFVVGLGANDVFRLQGPVGWERELRKLVNTVRERFGFAPVMLSAMPPIGQFPGLPQPLRAVLGLRARMLDEVTRQVAGVMAGVHFVPLDFEPDPGLFAADGVHPSSACYALWGRAVAEAALDHLPRRG